MYKYLLLFLSLLLANSCSFIDARTGNQVWRGVAVGAIDDLSRNAVDKQVEEAVYKIFKKFPEQPRPGMPRQ